MRKCYNKQQELVNGFVGVPEVMSKSVKNIMIYLMVTLIIALPFCAFLEPLTVNADEKTTLKVGCFTDMPYMMQRDDKTGRMSGYGYEYLQMIASYTGWEYEYVEGEWSELWQAFLNSDIDILVDVSYTEDRTQQMLFPDRPMGSEVYRLYTTSADTDIDASNLEDTLKGKIIGVTAYTVQEELLKNWVEENNIDCSVIGYVSDFVRNEYLEDGTIDAVVELEASALSKWEPIAEIGETEYYMALSLGNEDLIEEINSVLENISIVNPEYVQELYNKYFSDEVVSSRLNEMERDWLRAHNELNIGVVQSDKTRNMSEMLSELMEEIFVNRLKVDNLQVNCISYDSAEEMEEDLKSGRLDAIYPMFDDCWLAEQKGLSIVAEIEPVRISMIVSDATEDIETIGIAGSGLVGYYTDCFYPNATITEYETEEKLFDAVADGKVDAGISDGVTPDSIMNSQKKYVGLTMVENGDGYYKCLAVLKGNAGLYMMLRRGMNLVDESFINSLTMSYGVREVKFSWHDFFTENAVEITMAIVVLALIIIIFIAIANSIRARKLLALSRTDSLTQILNRSGEQVVRKKIEQQTEGMLCLLDIDDFKSFNDRFGHDAGDKVLIRVAGVLSEVFRKEDVVLRLGGDEFAVFMPGVVTKEVAESVLMRLINEIEKIDLQETEGVKVNISLGAAFYTIDEKADFEQLYKKADIACYESKRTSGSSYSFA